MRQEQGHGHLQSGSGESEIELGRDVARVQEPVDAQHLRIRDALGQEHAGTVYVIHRWPPPETESEPAKEDEDFRIIILREPPTEPIQPAPATVICAPSRPLIPGAVREAAVAYETGRRTVGTLVSPQAIELLGQGRLYARKELEVEAADIFAGGEARLELLAKRLITCEALAQYLEAMAIALAAPDAAAAASVAERQRELAALVQSLALRREELELEAREAIERLSLLVGAGDAEELLAAAKRVYPRPEELAEDVYLARAFRERPGEAQQLLSLRGYLREAVVSATETELALDRAIVQEQLQFACLVAEPQRLPAAVSALEHFREHYRERYLKHHRAYWEEMARLHTRLLEGSRQVEALGRLNSLTELGPPVGEAATALYQSLLEQSAGCPSAVELRGELLTEPVCRSCRLPLGEEPPKERVAEVLQRIARACERHMARLASTAVSQVLEHSGDPRVEQFLKVVQASQLSSLPEILDDELTGYLRRFLVEARINATLQPILSRLQEGMEPDKDEAQQVMQEIAQVLRRAFRAAQRMLPPPLDTLEEDPKPAKRKR